MSSTTNSLLSRTPPGVRELKPDSGGYVVTERLSRTPPGVRELKPTSDLARVLSSEGRTPPGVRELKPALAIVKKEVHRRTPPGVRELKLCELGVVVRGVEVAPLPGCVN